MDRVNSMVILCDSCGGPIPHLYCTQNICKECCETDKCPCSATCAAKHPEMVNLSYPERLKLVKK